MLHPDADMAPAAELRAEWPKGVPALDPDKAGSVFREDNSTPDDRPASPAFHGKLRRVRFRGPDRDAEALGCLCREDQKGGRAPARACIHPGEFGFPT